MNNKSEKVNERIEKIYKYIEDNQDCTYPDIFDEFDPDMWTIDAICELRSAGEIYHPHKDTIRVVPDPDGGDDV